MVFGGYGLGSVKNYIRWIGTESGIAPVDNWSADTITGESGNAFRLSFHCLSLLRQCPSLRSVCPTGGDGFGNGGGVRNGTDWVPVRSPRGGPKPKMPAWALCMGCAVGRGHMSLFLRSDEIHME